MVEQLIEYNITGDDSNASMVSNYQYCQAFKLGTTGQNKDSQAVASRVKLQRNVGVPGSMILKIKSTSPTGTILCSGIFDSSLVSTGGTGSFFRVDMNKSVTLSASTSYYLVMGFKSSSPTENLNWRYDSSPGTYGGGSAWFSSDSGASWSEDNPFSSDFMFEIIGSVALPSKQGEFHFNDAGTDKTLRLISTLEASGTNQDDTFRTCLNGSILCADLVSTNDVDASNVRVITPNGTKAWRSGA